jgi:hypothetical protein
VCNQFAITIERRDPPRHSAKKYSYWNFEILMMGRDHFGMSGPVLLDETAAIAVRMMLLIFARNPATHCMSGAHCAIMVGA